MSALQGTAEDRRFTGLSSSRELQHFADQGTILLAKTRRNRRPDELRCRFAEEPNGAGIDLDEPTPLVAHPKNRAAPFEKALPHHQAQTASDRRLNTEQAAPGLCSRTEHRYHCEVPVETPQYYTYAEQVQHYFDRPHGEVATVAVSSPSAWNSAELLSRNDWRTTLEASQLDELEAALAKAMSSGKPTLQLTTADFPLPTLQHRIREWAQTVGNLTGIHVVSGLPVGQWTPEEVERFFWCIGLHMGRPGTQNVHGDLLGRVTDTGDAVDDPYVRLYRTAADIAYHCDAADVVGLLCLRSAKKGGASRIVSSVSVYNALLEIRPDLACRLYEPLLLDIRNEDSSGTLRHIPVTPCCYSSGRLRTFYHSDYFRSVVRHEDVPALSPDQNELLDLYEELANDPSLYVEMELLPGDVQWLSNHTILHSRTAYEDWPDPGLRRHLLRLWLSL